MRRLLHFSGYREFEGILGTFIGLEAAEPFAQATGAGKDINYTDGLAYCCQDGVSARWLM